jgi:hypothetical protein
MKTIHIKFIAFFNILILCATTVFYIIKRVALGGFLLYSCLALGGFLLGGGKLRVVAQTGTNRKLLFSS